MEVLCKFSGLVAFPFDNLKCKFDIGGWAWSGTYQGIVFDQSNQGYSFNANRRNSYSEYQFESVTSRIYDVTCNSPAATFERHRASVSVRVLQWRGGRTRCGRAPGCSI
eukprot:4467285-Prymnesium_polylepis.1